MFETDNPLGHDSVTARSLPRYFSCPITSELMTDPVVDPEGNSYERSAIEDWLGRSATSPVTRAPLLPNQLVPNRALKDAIDGALAEQQQRQLAAAEAQPSTPAPSRLSGLHEAVPPSPAPVPAAPRRAPPPPPGDVPRELAAEMVKHGLTEADQRQLFEQGITTVDRFKGLSDANYPTSINVGARREAKRQRDQVAAQARHDQAVQAARERHTAACLEQVRQALAQAKLTDNAPVAAVLKRTPDVGALRRLAEGPDHLERLGFGAHDKQQLQNFCRGAGLRLVAPVREEVPPMERALTEPERQAEAQAEAERKAAVRRQQCEACTPFLVGFIPAAAVVIFWETWGSRWVGLGIVGCVVLIGCVEFEVGEVEVEMARMTGRRRRGSRQIATTAGGCLGLLLWGVVVHLCGCWSLWYGGNLAIGMRCCQVAGVATLVGWVGFVLALPSRNFVWDNWHDKCRCFACMSFYLAVFCIFVLDMVLPGWLASTASFMLVPLLDALRIIRATLRNTVSAL